MSTVSAEQRTARGWRVGAWASVGIAALAWMMFPAPPEDTWDLKGLLDRVVIFVAFVLAPAITGIVCAFQGAARGAASGDRRFRVILPVWASLGFLAAVWIRIFS